MKEDIKILKYLYSRKNDGIFYDVSVIFDVSNPENYINNIENENSRGKIVSSDNQKNNRKKANKHSIDKAIIDNFVVTLEENGYVVKKVPGYLPSSALSEDDDPSNANNSVCMISSKGIEYFENHIHNLKSRRIAIVSLVISIIAICISLLSKVF